METFSPSPPDFVGLVSSPKDPYISKIQIEVHAGEKLRITSVEYDDDCLTPCELCKKLGDAKAFLNRKLAER